MRICKIKNCSNKHRARGYCHNHLSVFYRHGFIPENFVKNQKQGKECLVNGCNKKPHAKNYCSSHYSKIKRWGQLSCPNDLRGKSLNSQKNLTYSIKKGNIPWNKGVHFKAISGEKHWNWQNGKTKEKRKIRASLEYKNWRTAVFERDNYTCQSCGDDRGGNLEADHIKPFAFFPKLRFDVKNGRTLCSSCHIKTDTYGRKALAYA